MAKRKEVIIGLHNVFTPNTDNLYDISTFSYEQSVDENTILFAIADLEDVGKYITINGEPKIISENDNFIITDGIVFSGNGGGSNSNNEYTGGTNIDITGSAISAKGYIFNETTNSFAEGSSTTSNTATGNYSHAEGLGTITTNESEHAEGRYNVSNKTVLNNNGHSYIDLGLPSGLLWATKNVGAETPQDSGLYFSWGNTDGHAVDENGNIVDGYSFNQTTYASTPGGQFTGNTLDTEHDAATAVMGGDWRMPTCAEAVELIENTDHYYIGEDGNTVAKSELSFSKNLRSICFVKKDEAFDYNNRSNFIEFPFAGNCRFSLLDYDGSSGYVWSSSAYATDALPLYFSNGGNFGDVTGTCFRYKGLPVRGVMSKQSNTYETISSIGIGTDETDRKNAFEVMQNGDVYINGIGDYDGKNLENVASIQTVISSLQEGICDIVEEQITYTPGNNISISEEGVITAKGYRYSNGDILIDQSCNIRGFLTANEEFISNGYATFKDNIVIKGSNDTTSAIINATSGNITTSGSMSAAQGFYETSDIRKKNVINELPLDKAYELINNCQSIIYTLKDNVDKQQIGLIAQEVQQYFPEVVSENEDGYLSLDYAKLTSVIFRVLKDVIDRLNKLENK